MSEISETEIKAMTKLQNYTCGYHDGKFDVLNKIRDEIIARDKRIKAVRSDNRCYFTVQEILNIIDMYTAESEEV